eukprot:TRINITY_DN11452_c0_g1_i1.p2 TRINITY_DN11452_c0_g1~~TRINITY_DN11452_c0_g1_i1.p2  ORF type:complete len:101 (+),score=20.37 TRINITY_DN11452_c0_g1_i1:23-304(+)
MAENHELARWDTLVELADLLDRFDDVFPYEFLSALAAGLETLKAHLPECTLRRLLHFIQHRSEWPSQHIWLTEMQLLVQDWQRHSRLQLHDLG